MTTQENHFDLSGFELRNARSQNLTSAPGSPGIGFRYFDTTRVAETYWNGTTWVDLVAPVPKSLLTANTILKADTSGVPAALNVVDAMVGAFAGVNGSVISAHGKGPVRTWLGSIDTFVPAAADLNLNNHKITSVASPTNAGDATPKSYVDTAVAAVASGLTWKGAVRVRSTANVTLATPGATMDGVTLVNGDRVLLVLQTTASENGSYTWSGASSALVRTTDADVSAEVVAGIVYTVTEGTTWADSTWVLSTNNPITLGTTALAFTRLDGGTTYTGTANRVTITGSQIDIAATYVGQTSINTLGAVGTGTWSATPIDLAHGGTGGTSQATARAGIGAVGKYGVNFGDGVATTYTITHGLNSLDVVPIVYVAGGGSEKGWDFNHVDVNTITVSAGSAPATNTRRVVVVG